MNEWIQTSWLESHSQAPSIDSFPKQVLLHVCFFPFDFDSVPQQLYLTWLTWHRIIIN